MKLTASKQSTYPINFFNTPIIQYIHSMLIKKVKFLIISTSFKSYTFALLLALLTACGGGSSGSDSSSPDTNNANNVDSPELEQASVKIIAKPDTVKPGQSSTISWQSENSVSCRAEDGWTTATSSEGSATVGPLTETTVFSMSCLGKKGGPISKSVIITLDNSTSQPEPAPEPESPPSNPAPQAPETPDPEEPDQEELIPLLILSADLLVIDENDSTTIRWTSMNSTSCTSSGWTSSTKTSGIQLVANITNTMTYNMTCTGEGGSVTESVTVTVNEDPPAPAPTLNLSADDLEIEANESTIIRWTSNNADACVANGDWSIKNDANGQQLISTLPVTTTYSMTCTGEGGSVTETVTVTVNQPVFGSVNLNWEVPTTNQDGSALSDLAGYTIYYGTNQTNLNQIININTAGVTSYVIENLPAATYYFSITAKDNNSNESIRSNIASKVIK